MNNKKTQIALLVALGLAAILLIKNDLQGVKTGDGQGGVATTTTATATTTTTTTISGVSMTGQGTVEQVLLSEGKKLPPAPTLNHTAEPENTLPFEARKIIRDRIAIVVADLKKDPKNVDNWIVLGVQWKTLGDLVYARDVWEYAKALNPSYYLVYSNLGDLYHYYLKDFKKSEENWKKSIELKPDHAMAYRELSKLYEYSMKEKAKEIPKVLNQGIAKNPTAVDLVVSLAQYYLTVEDYVKAEETYTRAITAAQKMGDETLATRLSAELESVILPPPGH